MDEIYSELNTSKEGFSPSEVVEILERYGKNQAAREESISGYRMLLNNFKNAFILVLILLGIVSYLSQDVRAQYR